MDLKEKIDSLKLHYGWSIREQQIIVDYSERLSKIVAISFFKWFYETYNRQYDGLPISGNTNLGGMTFYIDKEEHPFEYAYELFTQSKEYHELMNS